jgi:hypothetical protein
VDDGHAESQVSSEDEGERKAMQAGPKLGGKLGIKGMLAEMTNLGFLFDLLRTLGAVL